MRKPIAVAVTILLISAVPFESRAERKNDDKALSRKELKQKKEREEKDAILEILNTRSFTINIQTVRHDVTGAEYDLTAVRRNPEVLFRPNGIRFFVPYYTGNAPLDGISGNEVLAEPLSASIGPTGAPVYPSMWLDWSGPYPKDYEISEDKRSVRIKFTTDMGSGDTYFCEFIFTRKNCEFYIDCKSFTRTKYLGHLTKFE